MSLTTRKQPAPFLRYDGTIGELYPIFLLNLLLTVLTLGIWRFWAVTRIRRYVWSRTMHDGERFEYDGTGGQLFIGFLIAIGILFGIGVGCVVLAVILGLVNKALAILPVLVFELCVVVLALGAPFSAQRYRLNHTLWRGIRGGMDGSMLRYGLWSGLYLLASVFTLFQLSPWAALRRYERRVAASFLGSQRAQATGRAMDLYLAWLATFAGLVLLAVVVAAAFWAVEGTTLRLFAMVRDQAEKNTILTMLLPWLLLAYVAFFVGAALIACGYRALFFRHVTGHTSLGAIRFGSDVTAGAILSLVFVNLLLLIVTLGFGTPIVIHRNQRFLTDHLLSDGALDPASLRQIGQTPSRYGEGMFQALDAGAGIGLG